MEENLDSIKESNRNENDPLKKDIIDIQSSKETAPTINKNSRDSTKDLLPNENSKNSIKDLNIQKVNKENSSKVINDLDNKNVEDENSKTLKVKPKKELPIEKKPFNEFINDHLLPSIVQEFKVRGIEVADINLKNTSRPIAGDKCWVIFCEVKDICNFWLSFEKDDISSLKSISLCKFDQKPSVIESFLIDEKRITLKLIISRILQRLNGQKLIGIN